MSKTLKSLIKITALVVSVMTLVTGCLGSASGELDFDDVTYTMNIATESKDDVSSDEDVSSEDAPSSSLPSDSSADVTSSDTDSETEDEDEDENTNDNGLPVLLNPNGFNINSVTDVQKFSCVDSRISVATFLPNVGYLENGVAKDVMFDGMAFIPSPNFVHDYGDSEEGIKPMTKEDWWHYIHNLEFREGYNIDALNEATGMVKKALDMPDYKVGVFLAVMKPSARMENWGEIDGKTLNFKENPEDKITALKWMVDESIRTFNEKKYEHLELCGFYYYQEYVYDEDKAFVLPMTDYIRSLKYITIFAPFYRARGYDKWKEFGFDRATMQANYFPGTNLPNAGGKDRIVNTALLTNERQMGFEMELTGTGDVAVEALKEYYKAGISYGFMQKYHTWWIMAGPTTVRQLCNSKDPFTNSAYREMYLFIHNRLNTTQITWKE